MKQTNYFSDSLVGKVDFRWSQFDSTADFFEAQFDSTADFYKAKFDSIVYFDVTKFAFRAIFRSAHFASGAAFNLVQFNSTVIFDDNYRDCRDGKDSDKHCPFIMKNMNPCGSKECRGVNWRRQQFAQLRPECKSRINHYCSINSKTDPVCICWNPKFANTERCRSHRSQFADRTINSCSVDIFNIEDHPNFKNYVRKDNIPCYGCDL